MNDEINRNGFDYILLFFDRIYRIYRIYFSSFPREIKKSQSHIRIGNNWNTVAAVFYAEIRRRCDCVKFFVPPKVDWVSSIFFRKLMKAKTYPDNPVYPV